MGSKHIFWIRAHCKNGNPVKKDKDRLCCDYEPEPEGKEVFLKAACFDEYGRVFEKLLIACRTWIRQVDENGGDYLPGNYKQISEALKDCEKLLDGKLK